MAKLNKERKKEELWLGQPVVKAEAAIHMVEGAAHTINSINGYVISKGKEVLNDGLQITLINNGIIPFGIARQLKDGSTYYPVTLTFVIPNTKPALPGRYSNNYRNFDMDLVYINGLGRPNGEHIMRKFSQILKTTCPDNPDQIQDGRYVFCMNRLLPLPFTQFLLDNAKKGDGTVIDYTWISYFQNLIEMEEEKVEEKTLKKKGTKGVRDAMIADPADDGLPLPTPDLIDRAVAEEKARVKRAGLLDAIKQSTWRTSYTTSSTVNISPSKGVPKSYFTFDGVTGKAKRITKDNF